MSLSAEDNRLFDAFQLNNADEAEAAAAVQQAIRDGANVNAVRNNWATPLFEACRLGYDQIIRILLDAGADARWRNRYGLSAMSEACRNGHWSTVRLLINHDSSLFKMTNNEGWTPLFKQIRGAHDDLARLLLAAGADPHRVNKFGETALMLAAIDRYDIDSRLFDAVKRNDADADAAAAVQQAIRDGANVNAVHNYSTPLMLACRRGYDQIIRILLDAGADATWNGYGWSAVTDACYQGHLFAVQLLINHDNGLLEMTNDYGRKPLFVAIDRNYPDIVRFLLDSGANTQPVDKFRQIANENAAVEEVRNFTTPLLEACRRGYDEIVGILLDAGADAWWSNGHGESAISEACYWGNLSTVQLLINHDNGLLEFEDNNGWTPLIRAIRARHSDIVRFLLDSGANPHHVRYGFTTLMRACKESTLEIVRLLLAAGAEVEARDEKQQTALHYAARNFRSMEVVRELILQHNANMFVVDVDGRTPFDAACDSCSWMNATGVDPLLEVCGNKLTQDHGRLALHKLLKVAKYSFAEDKRFHPLFHPPMNPLRIILPLGRLKVTHLRTLLRTMSPELIRNRDDTGKLPLHIACRANAPVEVLALILELDPTTLRTADYTGALPIHLLCGTAVAATVRYLVEQGGAGTLAARNRQGLLPLHVLCGSTNPPLRAVQYLIQSFPGSVAMRTNAGNTNPPLRAVQYLIQSFPGSVVEQTNAGDYPFMVAASDSSTASLSVVYELLRANPGLAFNDWTHSC